MKLRVLAMTGLSDENKYSGVQIPEKRGAR